MKQRRRQKVALRKSHLRYRWGALLHSFWVVGRWGLAAALAVWMVGTLHLVWRDADWFKVRRVMVDPEAPANLAQALPVKTGDHLFGFSPNETGLALERKFPGLSEVSVRRWWDGSVRVSVEKRKPVARMFDGEKWLGLDAQGVLFPLTEPGDSWMGLPVYAGAAGRRAVPVIQFFAALKETEIPWTKRLVKFRAASSSHIFLYLEDGTPLYWGGLPEEERLLRQKARRLERVLQDEMLAGGVAYARFVDNTRIAVKLKKPEEKSAGGLHGKT